MCYIVAVFLRILFLDRVRTLLELRIVDLFESFMLLVDHQQFDIIQAQQAQATLVILKPSDKMFQNGTCLRKHNNMQGRLQTVVYLDSYQETQNDMSLAVAMKDTQFAVVNQSDFA
ncbi:UNVERIFIED_CONTAM: hypothetical protein FKN15_062561 [Acipenser sinensis]